MGRKDFAADPVLIQTSLHDAILVFVAEYSRCKESNQCKRSHKCLQYVRWRRVRRWVGAGWGGIKKCKESVEEGLRYISNN